MMHMGEMTKSFVGIGKEAQADIKPEDAKHANNVATLLGIDAEWMINYFCKPKLKVGVEWVTKGQTVAQASNSVAGIARSLYERTFKYVVNMCNDTLIDPTMKRVQFIGVLDIAGFEIFDYNGFEQICINFANEKLQQFFNHHMFVLEQEEYMREGIEWAMVDFGMDLQKCIEMFEKPMGVLAILEVRNVNLTKFNKINYICRKNLSSRKQQISHSPPNCTPTFWENAAILQSQTPDPTRTPTSP